MVDSVGMASTQSNYYSKQVLSNTDYGNDESRSCKILPANHLHKSLPHNASSLESSHPACQPKPASDDSSRDPSPTPPDLATPWAVTKTQVG
jgi:hypothetical protein